MRPPGWRRIFLSKLISSAFILILVLYIVLFRIPRLSSSTVKPSSSKVLDKSNFRLQQNGEYWIYHDFLRPLRSLMYGNDTITLATHGNYMDFGKLEWLLVRWSAPISLAVYVSADDFEATLNSFYHIKYCTIYGFTFNQWVSVQLIFEDKHVPSNLRAFSNSRGHEFHCKAPYEQEVSNDTFSHSHQHYNYPLHLLKNVARLNARTYFVLATEIDMLPTRRLAKNFLQFVELYQPAHPLHTVYCIPIIPQIFDDRKVPTYKSDLVTLVAPYLSHSHLSFSLSPQDWEQLRNLDAWLNTSIHDGEIGVHKVSEFSENCAAYISSNSYEPFYDQRIAESPYLDNTTRHQVLNGLGFDFVVLDGTFLIRRRAAWWEENRASRFDAPSTDQNRNNEHILELIKFNSLTLWPRFR